MKTIIFILTILFSLENATEAKFAPQSQTVNSNVVRRGGSSSVPYNSNILKNTTKKEVHNSLVINKTFSSFLTRVVSALFAVSTISIIIRTLGDNGIKGIILASQVGLFSEAMNVVSVKDSGQWWALLTNMVYWDTRHTYSNCYDSSAVNLLCFGMVILHIITMILEQNRVNNFSDSLRSFCLSYTTGAILVGMSSSWLMILQLFRSKWIYYPFLLVIINDTMAYFCGILLGKYKILPNISPNKTWEGFMGAAVCTLAICKPLGKWIGIDPSQASALQLYMIGSYTSFIAPFGGFLASAVKRNFGHKDFGTILPGHGGLIDRLDCHILTAPFILLFLKSINTSS
jgi:phosphatidate cytidylyltransferase